MPATRDHISAKNLRLYFDENFLQNMVSALKDDR